VFKFNDCVREQRKSPQNYSSCEHLFLLSLNLSSVLKFEYQATFHIRDKYYQKGSDDWKSITLDMKKYNDKFTEDTKKKSSKIMITD